MLSKIINEVGNVHGLLKVISRSENKHGRVYWNCVCACGGKTKAAGRSLRKGLVISCGCEKRGPLASKYTPANVLKMRQDYWQSVKYI